MDIALKTQTYGSGDYSHLVDPEDFLTVGCTIDLALISDAQMASWETAGLNVIPAGTALGINAGICALWGTDQVNEVQKLTPASSGATTVGFQGVNATATTFAADSGGATTLLGLINGLPDIEPGDFTVTVGTSGDAGKLIITAAEDGNWAAKNVPTFSVSGTGTAISTATGGAPGAYEPAGLVAGDVRFTKGARTGKVGAARMITGAVYESKLPFATADDGTPGKVDAEFIAAPKLAIAYA